MGAVTIWIGDARLSSQAASRAARDSPTWSLSHSMARLAAC